MISIIMPVYNEEAAIGEALSGLLRNNNIEVIVADGNSSDRTVELAKRYPVKIIFSKKGRAQQMNAGAKAAAGRYLIFLHADCFLESGAIEAIKGAFNDGYAGGCLSCRINSPKIMYRLIEASGNIRARISKIFYGDQAIFARRDIFFKIGGFDDVALFEDILFSQKMKKEGRAAVLSKAVYASARRWERGGIIKTTFIYWLLTLGFYLRFPLVKLKRIYDEVR
ncbi:glycosyltransferase [bacterium]|nr:MAG: glycosyltransferase [bacterium]